MTGRRIELQNVKVSNVKPAEIVQHPTEHNVSLFDLPGIDGYFPILFLYTSEAEVDSSEFATKVKSSLAEILVPYYPFAGRSERTYDATIRRVLCHDQGVPFIEAYIDDDMDDVIDIHKFQAVKELSGYEYVGLDFKHFNHDEDILLPSIIVQTTRFKCGGVALHVAINHMVADGNGMFQFMHAWSQIALHGRTSFFPVHDRSLTVSAKEFLESLGLLNEPEEGSDSESADGKPRVDPGAGFKLQEEVSVSNLALDVKGDVVLQLKTEAAKRGMKLSTIDLITAHLWRSFNSIPEHTDKKTSTVAGTFVDGRARFHSPPLPEHYAGNVIVFAPFPRVSVDDLAVQSHFDTAALIHDKVRSVNANTWRDTLLETMGLFSTKSQDRTNRLVIVTSWFRFPMYEIDFGCGFGKPVYATSNYFYKYQPSALVVIQPPPPSRSKDTVATIHFVVDSRNGVAEALFSDSDFRSFFH